jgi:hypothetical protein
MHRNSPVIFQFDENYLMYQKSCIVLTSNTEYGRKNESDDKRAGYDTNSHTGKIRDNAGYRN